MSAIALSRVVPPEAVARIRAAIKGGTFVSGKLSAVGGAADLKENAVLSPVGRASEEATGLLVAALQASSAFQTATWPEAMTQPMFCRYGVGQKYGEHIDAAIMGEGGSQIRCDVSVTVCLSDPSEYDGGELVIDTAGVPGAWKGGAGDVIVYPSDTLHRVTEVTRGTREVAIAWIQSMVREPGRRRILYDLRAALDAFDQSRDQSRDQSGEQSGEKGDAPAAVEALRRSYFNLIRMWA